MELRRFLGGSDGKEVNNLSALQEIWVLSLAGKRFPGEGNGYPLQYSCLENSKDRGAWWATADGVAKNWTQLSDFHFTHLKNEAVTNLCCTGEVLECIQNQCIACPRNK